MARKNYICKTINLPDGTRKYIYGKTQEEVEQKYIEARLQLRAGVDLKNHDTFGEFAQMWYTAYIKSDKSSEYAETLKARLNNHIMPKLAAYRMKDITPMMCKQVFTSMTEAGKGNGLQRSVYQMMCQIFTVAEENGVIYKSPMTSSVKPGGKPNTKRKALTDDQVDSLLALVDGQPIGPFVVLCLNTGLRRSEALGLLWENVNLERGEIYVRTQLSRDHSKATPVLKTNAAYRTIPLSPEAQACLEDLLDSANGPFVFHGEDGRPIKTAAFEKLWNITSILGMGHALTPHALRHTAITRWIAFGLDVKEVQYLAGHSDVTTTLNIYASYLKESRYETTREKIRCGTTKKQGGTGGTVSTDVPQEYPEFRFA